MGGNLEEMKEIIVSNVTTNDCDDENKLKNEILRLINTVDIDGNAAIHGAVFSGHVDIVQYLINIGADITSPNNIGCTPFWLSCGYNQVKVLEILLQNDFCVQKSLTHSNNTGDTPLIALHHVTMSISVVYSSMQKTTTRVGCLICVTKSEILYYQ